jgi:hypothetical protein
MKTHTTIIAAVCALVIGSLAGRAEDLSAIANAMLRTSDPASNWFILYPSSNGWCNLNTPAGASIGGMFLFQFDLTPYAGKLVDGDGTLSYYCYWHQPGFFFSYDNRQVLSNWDESTVTWENFIGPTTDDTWLAVVGGAMDLQTVDASGAILWTVSNDVVQGWIDAPADNHGVAVASTGGGGNDCWRTRFWTTPDQQPRLLFDIQSLNNPPRTPTNLAPANAAMQVSRSAFLSASAFSDPDGDGHGASQWQVATDPGFIAGTIAWDSGTAAGLTTTTTAQLQYNTRYWWRVRYEDDSTNGAKWSTYSDPTWFDTEFNVIDPIQKQSVGMAMILPAGPNSNINSRTSITMNVGNPPTNVAPSGFIMIQFDLSVFNSLTGAVVQGDGSLDVWSIWSDINFPANFGVYALKAPWSETNVTWNNYIGGDWSAWTNLVGPELDFVVMDDPGLTAQFAIAQSVIQGWISSPTGNYGVALIPDATGNVVWRTDPNPLLTFDLVNTNAPVPDKPVNVSPVNGATGVGQTPVLTCTAYSGSGTPAASDWRIARDTAMSDLAWQQSGNTNLTSVVVLPSNSLAKSTRYYWQARHSNTEGGKSEWSDTTYFDTEVVTGCRTNQANMNAMIRPNASFIYSNYNGTMVAVFDPNGGSNGVRGGVVLLWFDLGVFEGLDADGDATLMVQYDFVDVNFGDIFFTCYKALMPWNEATVTWENLMGAETNINVLLGESYGSSLAVENESSVWTIAQATIQEWLDNEATNFGLAIYPDQGNANVFMRTRQAPARAPTLAFCVIPEPGMLAGVALAALALVRKLRG